MPVFFPKTQDYRPGERFLRLVLLGAVFAGVIWAFWKHSENVAERFATRQTVNDPSGSLSGERKQFVKDFARGLKEAYGLDFRLSVAEEAALPPADAKTVDMALSPARREALVRFPPLLAGALGPDYARDAADRLVQAMGRGEWQDELVLVLADLWDRLDQLKGTTTQQ